MTIKYFIKVSVFLAILYFHSLSIYAQDQRVVDSLFKVYQEDKLTGVDKLELLRKLSKNDSNFNLSLKYAEELIALSKLEKNYLYLYRGYMRKGYSNIRLGNFDSAIADFFKSAEAATLEGYIAGEGTANMAIADAYSEIGNSKNSEIYYNKSIELLRKTNDSISLAMALLNSGDEYFNTKKYDLALRNFKESGKIFKNANHLSGVAYNFGNIGMVNAEQGYHNLAKANISKAINILEKLEDYYAISEYLIYMSDIYVNQNDFKTALNYAHRSLELAKKYGLKKQISDANLKLSKLYETNSNLSKSLKYYKNYIVYKDSVRNIDAVQQMANLRTDFEVQKKQDEISFLEKEALINQLKDKRNKAITYATGIVAFLILMLALGVFRRYRFIKKTSKIIQKETDKSEKLLLNILPEETAKELKQYGKVQAKQFGSVSVMFTDFKEFTNISNDLSPEELVKSVDFYFSKFDSIIEKYGLEKIKTIGDAYMCAGGLPFPTIDHADKMIQAAFEIAEFMEISKNRNDQNIKSFEVRIGINTGPVVAGVVGTKKFAYDIWGDTVNVASRMESTSLPGKINISETTYELIKDKYECEYRGEISVKNKGMMKMYFVQGLEIENYKTKLVKQKSEL